MQQRSPSPGAAVHPELEPLVASAIRLLESTPRGASRKDIVAAMSLNDAVWTALRDALDATGLVLTVGRGPGQRHVHRIHADSVPESVLRLSQRALRTQDLAEARDVLRDVLQHRGEIDSGEAQRATGLGSDPVRRLLIELVDEGRVRRSGNKRTTRYRWIG